MSTEVLFVKINNECARKILLEVEKIPFGETLTIAKLQENMPEYSIDEVLSSVALFNKERYVVLLDKYSYDDTEIFRDHKVRGLTEKGYKTLDLIRDEDTWTLIKEKIDNFDELSIFTIFNIADKIMNVKYNTLFDLPKDLLIPNNRW